MRLGLFMMPLHPGEKDVAQCYDEDLELLVRSDERGLDEAWIGEHFTSLWENIPPSDLLIAKALAVTRWSRFGTGVVCLPQHHPALVAPRIACLDHLAHGRFCFGIGAGGVPMIWSCSGSITRAASPEYLVDEIWIVGDPPTCARKLRALSEEVGGFGTLLMICHDWDDRTRWLRSLELLTREVVPALADL